MMNDGNSDWLTLLPDNASDEEHDGVNSVAAQRQERIRKAFELSKASYQTELVVLSPSFFRVEPQDVVRICNEDRFGLQNLDSSIHDAYSSRDYQRALDLCLTYLDGVEGDLITLEGSGLARNRECYDVALRSCTKLPLSDMKLDLAPRLIQRSSSLWKAHYPIGMAAAELYLSIDRPRDALSVLLSSTPSQPAKYPFLHLLERSLSALHSSQSATSTATRDAISSIRSIIANYAERASGPYYTGAPSTIAPKVVEYPSESEVRVWGEAIGTEGDQLDALVRLCTSRTSADDEGDATTGGKSVRSL